MFFKDRETKTGNVQSALRCFSLLLYFLVLMWGMCLESAYHKFDPRLVLKKLVRVVAGHWLCTSGCPLGGNQKYTFLFFICNCVEKFPLVVEKTKTKYKSHWSMSWGATRMIKFHKLTDFWLGSYFLFVCKKIDCYSNTTNVNWCKKGIHIFETVII